MRPRGWRGFLVSCKAICLVWPWVVAPIAAQADEGLEATSSEINQEAVPSDNKQSKPDTGVAGDAPLLLEQAAWCVATGCERDPTMLLARAKKAVLKGTKSAQQVVDLLQIARLEAQLGAKESARSTLHHARESLAAVSSSTASSELMGRIALGYRALGEEETARILDENVKAGTTDSGPLRYPFPSGPPRVEGGLAVSGTSFDEITANGSATFSLFKPWTNQDLSTDIIASLNYDSGRDVNRLKPNVSTSAVYRYHLSDDWSLFLNNLTAVNSGVVAGSTDDEDTSVLTASYLGPGLNLWRGETSERFLDLQLGFGARYEYEEINLKVQRDNFSPSIALILYGRDIPIGKARFSPTLGMGAGSGRLDELVVYADLNLQVPISTHWEWNSRIVARYTTESPTNNSQNLNYQYLTGLTYKFHPSAVVSPEQSTSDQTETKKQSENTRSDSESNRP